MHAHVILIRIKPQGQEKGGDMHTYLEIPKCTTSVCFWLTTDNLTPSSDKNISVVTGSPWQCLNIQYYSF